MSAKSALHLLRISSRLVPTRCRLIHSDPPTSQPSQSRLASLSAHRLVHSDPPFQSWSEYLSSNSLSPFVPTSPFLASLIFDNLPPTSSGYDLHIELGCGSGVLNAAAHDRGIATKGYDSDARILEVRMGEEGLSEAARSKAMKR